ncbi:MAG: hypothetical protein ACI30L_00690 [Muribaculaceae bacterium]
MTHSIRHISYGLVALLLLMMSSCFTGVESTKKITDKDVKKVVEVLTQEEVEANTLAIPTDSFACWNRGKQFYVCDNNARLIFAPSAAYNADTLNMKGKILAYDGYHLGSVLDNRNTVNIEFTDGKNKYVYSTDKTIGEIKSGYTIPFLIDMDVVRFVASKLEQRTCYIKTPIWYDLNEEMTAGRKFVEVRIDSVLPGNKVFPLKVMFTDIEARRKAMLWMTAGGTVLKNRSFDALFSLTDLRKRYPDIESDVWQCIVAGKVKTGMTKDEVRLSLGNPSSINQRPTYEGVREYWYYPDGRYLYFEDGLLVER